MTTVHEVILHCQKQIKKNPPPEKLLHYLRRLGRLRITIDDLRETGVGKTVNKLSTLEGEVGQCAAKIVEAWKQMAMVETQVQEQRQEDDEEADDGGNDEDGKEEEEMEEEIEKPETPVKVHMPALMRDGARSSDSEDELEIDTSRRFDSSPEHAKNSDDEIGHGSDHSDSNFQERPRSAGHYEAGRKSTYHRSHDSSDEEPDPRNQYVKTSSRSSGASNSSSESSSDSEDENANSRHIRDSPGRKEKVSSSHSGHHSKPLNGSVKHESRKHERSGREHERHRERDHHHHRKEQKDYKREKRDKSSHHDEGTFSKSIKTESSSSARESSKSNKHVESKLENGSHHHRDGRDKKRSHSKEVVESSSSHHDKHRDRSSASNHRSKEKERKHEREKKSDHHEQKKKEESRKHREESSKSKSKDHRREKESKESDKKERGNHVEDQSQKHQREKRERDNGVPSSTSIKVKSEPSSDSDSEVVQKPASSSSSHKRKRDDTSPEKKEKGQKKQKLLTQLEKDEIDSTSGLNFADVLGCIDKAVVTKSVKKTAPPSKSSSSKPTTSRGSSDSGYKSGGSSSSKKTGSVIPPPPKLPKQENYAPPVPTFLPPKPAVVYKPSEILPSDDNYSNRTNYELSLLNPSAEPPESEYETLSTMMKSRKDRTKVYSGHKTGHVGQFPTLFQMCIRVIQDNLDYLGFTGGVPYDILKPAIERATVKQLSEIEDHNPYLMESTDELWKLHCHREFRNELPELDETWRDLYYRRKDEQQEKLKKLASKVKKQTELAQPVRKAKLAYVEPSMRGPRFNKTKAATIKNGMKTLKHREEPGIKAGGASYSASSGSKNVVTEEAAIVISSDSRAGAAPAPSRDRDAVVIAKAKPRKAPLMQKTMKLIKSIYRR